MEVKNSWLSQCCSILYSHKIAEEVTLFEIRDKILYLAFSRDFVEGEYIDYIAKLNSDSCVLPKSREGGLVKYREYFKEE